MNQRCTNRGVIIWSGIPLLSPRSRVVTFPGQSAVTPAGGKRIIIYSPSAATVAMAIFNWLQYILRHASTFVAWRIIYSAELIWAALYYANFQCNGCVELVRLLRPPPSQRTRTCTSRTHMFD
jgi:hypothetical protein